MSVAIDKDAAVAAGYGAVPAALTALGARNRGTLNTKANEGKIRRERVRATPGHKPETWYHLADCASLNASGDVAAAQWDGQWQRHRQAAPDAEGRRFDAQGRRVYSVGLIGRVERAEDDGFLRASKTLERIRAGAPEHIQIPSTALDRLAEKELLAPREAIGHYRLWHRDDVDAALPAILRFYDSTPPPGYVSRRETGRRLGIQKLEWVDELGNRREIEAHPTLRPRVYSLASIGAYNQRRVLTKGSERIADAIGRPWPRRRAARELGITPDWLTRGWRLGAVQAVQQTDARGRVVLSFEPGEITRIAATRPDCECGCGARAWQWWSFAATHHLRLPAIRRVMIARKQATRLFRASESPSPERAEWAEHARGLCEVLSRANARRRGQHHPDTGRRIEDESLEMSAEIVIGLSLGRTLTETAAILEAHFRRNVTRKQLNERRKWLDDRGREHTQSCKECSMFGRYV